MTQSGIVLSLFSLLATINSQSQDYTTLRGTVLDSETRGFLVGASIRILGTTIGTQSDKSGQFSLDVPNKLSSDSLIVTYVGYKKYGESILKLKDKANLQINLISEATNLKEVIVHSDFWRKQYSPAQLREDYTKFYTIMEKVHTGLFDYLPEKEWQALKDSCFQLFEYPMSHSEFYRLIAFQVGKVRNVHTKHGVTEWWYRQKQNIFPFNARYFDDKLYVSESLIKELDFPKGCEIVLINGRTPREIKDMIWPYIPADGFIETNKLALLGDYFPWYFSLYVEEATDYNIKLKKLNGEEITITTPGLRDSFSHLSFQQVMKWKKPALELKIDRNLKTAYFRIEDSRVFKDSIQNYFKRIRDNKIQYLIIDLRGGGGIREGEQVVELYSYLVNKPFQAYKSIEVKSNDWSLFDKDFTYKPYAKSLNEIKTEFFDKLVPSGNGSYLWQEEALKKFNQPSENNFTGTVYILADGRNYSASTSFTSLASQLDNVFVIGEETGGEYRSYVSGAMYGLVLPNSKILVKVATWKSTLAIEEKPANRGRGVMPDYPVSVSLEDFISGTDVVKQFAYELISNGRELK